MHQATPSRRQLGIEAKGLAQQAEQLRLAGDAAGAVTLFTRALALVPEFVWALAHRGAAYRQSGKTFYPQALADFEKAVALQPDYVWAVAFRARMYELFRDYERALVDFDRAIAMDDTIIGFWRSERALLLCFNRRTREAAFLCEEALRLDEGDHFAAYVRAVIALRYEKNRHGNDWVNRALDLLQPPAANDGPQQGIALYRLAGLAALRGRPDHGLTLLERALPLEKEAIEFARHDPAWFDLHADPRFQVLVTDRFGDLTIG